MEKVDTVTLNWEDTLRLSQKYLVPFSERLLLPGGSLIPHRAYQFDYLTGTLVLTDSSFNGQAAYASYRYFPRFLEETFSFRNFRIEKDTVTGEDLVFVDDYDYGPEQPFFIPSNVRRSGSISRGISIGNNQSLSVTSGLRLQLEGDLGDDLRLQAAITDENIPIQPDGTTQQIQDFDRVFIQLLRGNDNVILGDFEINHKGTQFANFYRNVQGIGLQIREDNFQMGVRGAVAKGKFNTNSFQGEEGKQGPYRLVGRNGERFIIVLAGSEKVFLNGESMTRGEGNDYVMDYNSGELRFTSQRVITSASRIVVDFEYTDRNYNRSLFFTDASYSFYKDRVKISASYGRDADNPNAPIDGAFSEEALDSLRIAGDNEQLAIVTGIDSVGPSTLTTVIRYARRDTTIDGTAYTRYVFTSDSDAVYQITFSNVGQGNGNYTRVQSLVNGTIYIWVAPDSLTGQPQGNYAPVRALVPAKMFHVADALIEARLSNRLTLYSEVAVSSEDKNRQSALDDDDNIDLANKAGVRLNGIKMGDSLDVKVDFSYRYVGKRYNNIDRVYKVEYGREWNYDDLSDRLTENVGEAIAELRYSDKIRITANAGARTYGTRLFSLKQLYELESSHQILQGKYTFTTISTEDSQDSRFSRWTRHNGDVYKTLVKGKLKVGSEVWIEDKSNEKEGFAQQGAFSFYDLKPYIKIEKDDQFSLHLYYNYRKEYEFLDSLIREKSIAHTEYAKLIWSPRSNLSLQNTSSLRHFEVLDPKFLDTGVNDNLTFITNTQASFFTQNRLIFSSLIYEATSEQLARKQVAYVEVNPGQGDYEWIDSNNDGVQDLDEFQYSINPARSNFFVRVVVPTTELFPTTALNFSGNFKLDLKKTIGRSKNFWKETVRNFLSITNFRVTQKKAAGSDFSNFLINLGDVFADSTLLDAQYTLKQDFYFYRNNKVGDIRLGLVDNKLKQFLASGTETRGLRSYGTDQRLNIGRSKSIENKFKIGNRSASAASFNSRNFNIDFFEVNPKMNYQMSRKFRLSVGYEYKNKRNLNDSMKVDVRVNLHKLALDAKWNLKERNNIFARLELVQIAQEGLAGFSAEYEMRESLEPGFNAIWQVFTTIYLSKSLELRLTYDGRSSQGSKVLHTGRVNLKAFF